MRVLSKSSGLSLIELLVVTAILAVLLISGATAYSLQRQRGLDARRKSDLAKLKIVFEDYYNDNGCYPSQALMSQCGQGDLRPYMEKVPCDPSTKQAYGVVVDAACTYYAVFTTLQDVNDPVISEINCSPVCATGRTYNYGVTNSGLPLSSLALELP